MKGLLSVALAAGALAIYAGVASADNATNACGGSDTVWSLAATSDSSVGNTTYLSFFDKNGDGFVCWKSSNGNGSFGGISAKDDVQAKTVGLP